MSGQHGPDSADEGVRVGERVEFDPRDRLAKGGRYATIGSSDAIFVIPDAAVDLLSSSVIDK